MIQVEINKEEPLTCRKDKINARETWWRIMMKKLGRYNGTRFGIFLLLCTV